jgi:hypothetical protein
MNDVVSLATLDDFAQRLRGSNPFLANRVDRIGPDLVDVADIHQVEFQRILDLGRLAHEENRGIGVVVWGEAGVGKSHLLARLARWAPERACFVYLHNVQASPQRLPRYLVKCVINVLTGGQTSPLWKTPLFHLLNAAVKEALGGDHVKRAMWSEIEAGYYHWIERLADAGGADRTVQDVLLRFFRAANPLCPEADESAARLAVRWLSGDSLDVDEARRIGLRPEDTAEEAIALLDNQMIKQVLVGLARIARSGKQLFLLCFDQADNLDEEQVRGLSRFLHDLLDSAGNLLVLTTGVRETMLGFRERGVITETSWNRIGQFTFPLGRIHAEQAHALVIARQERFRALTSNLPPIAARFQEDALFPLGEGWWHERTRGLIDFRPRDLLTWAGERWQSLQDSLQHTSIQDWLAHWPTVPEAVRPPPTRPLEQIIDEKLHQKIAEQAALRQPDTLPPSEDNLQRLVQQLLGHCVGYPELYALTEVLAGSARRAGAPVYDLAVYLRRPDDQMTEVGVRFITETSATSVTASLRRMVQDGCPPDRVLLVTNERQKLPLGARGKEYLENLEQRGPKSFQQVALSFAEYAVLDALLAVVGLARAGDLEVEHPPGKRYAVTEAEVIASHHRCGRYLNHRLLNQLLCHCA